MRAAISFCCLGTLTVFAFGQQPDQDTPAGDQQNLSARAIEILRKADETARSVKSVCYRGEYTAVGELAGLSPGATYRTLQRGELGSPSFQHVTEVTYRLPNSDQTRQATLGSDGTIYFLIDPATRTVHEDIVPHVFGRLGQLVQRMWMREFLFPRPFGDELNAAVIRFEGAAAVGGEECFEIYVAYSNTPERATWFFSTSDYLPRRVDRELPHMGGVSRLVVSEIVIDPEIDETMFTLQLPEGYARTDEFAP